MDEEYLNEIEDNENDYNMREDKIINNSYNTGEIEYQDFSTPMKVHDKVAGQYTENLSENIIEERTIIMLNNKLFELFEKSEFYEKYKIIKRVDKGDMLKMYYYFKSKLENENFSNSQIFIGFAEFFQINYDQLYNEVGVKDKQQLLIELNSQYGLNKRINTKKLF